MIAIQVLVNPEELWPKLKSLIWEVNFTFSKIILKMRSFLYDTQGLE